MEESKKVATVTERLQLIFPVNLFKKYVKKYFKDHHMESPNFKNGHMILAGLNEVLIVKLLQATIKEMKKNNVGLYDVEFNNIRQGILLDSTLRPAFLTYLDTYREFDYETMYPVPKKKVIEVIQKLDKAVLLDAKAYQLLVYFLNVVTQNIVYISQMILNLKQRKSLDDNIILSALQIEFKHGDMWVDDIKKILEPLIGRIADIKRENKKDKPAKEKKAEADAEAKEADSESDDDDDDDDADDEDEDEKKDTKQKLNKDKKEEHPDSDDEKDTKKSKDGKVKPGKKKDQNNSDDEKDSKKEKDQKAKPGKKKDKS